MTILVVGVGATGVFRGTAGAGRPGCHLPGPPASCRATARARLRIVGPGAGADARQALRPNLVMAGDLTEPADVVLLAVKATAHPHHPAAGGLDQLSGAGFDASISDEIIARMWQKWVFIATVGALTCLMRGTVGDIVAVPGGRDLGPAILAEASAVSAAAGYPMPADAIASTTQPITQAGSPVDSSMSRDAAEGRPAEVEQLRPSDP